MAKQLWKTTAATLATGALIGGTAFAADATFHNHLQSTTMVSPAQLYQIDALTTDFQLGFINVEADLKPDGGDESTAKATGTDVFAAGIYNVKDIGLRAGLSVQYTTGTSETKAPNVVNNVATTVKTKTDTTTTVVTPQAAYQVGPVAFGLAYEINQQQEKPEEGDTSKVSYNTSKIGGLFAEGPIEAGVAYESATNNNPDPVDDADVIQIAEPAIVTLHGRYAVSDTMAFGGMIINRAYKNLDDEANKDQQSFVGTAEIKASDVKIEGDLAYNTAFYKDKDENLSPLNIGTFGLGAAALYSVNEQADVGGALAYTFGSDKNDNYEVSQNALGFAVRGNMAF